MEERSKKIDKITMQTPDNWAILSPRSHDRSNCTIQMHKYRLIKSIFYLQLLRRTFTAKKLRES